MTKKLIIPLMLAALFAFTACDTVEEPYEENPDNNDTTGTVKKNVMIEEFTGINCGNCPDAAETAHHIVDQFEGKVISIGIHSGFYAKPQGEQPDFRTDLGNALFDYYGLEATPNGLINRSTYNNKTVLNHSDWASAAATQKEEEAGAEIKLISEYNSETRQAELTVDMKYLKNQNDNADRLNVFVVEDSIIGPQTWYGKDPSHIDDYVHRNVLRTSLTGTWGEVISESGAMKGDEFQKQYNYTVPENYKSHNLIFVAFLTNDDDTYSVINVDWIDMTDVRDDDTPVLTENPVVIHSEASTTVTTNPFGSNIELIWDVELENTSENAENVNIGYKIKSLVEGQAVAVCAGVCLPPTTDDYQASPMEMAPGEITGEGIVSLHLYTNPDDLPAMPKGTSVIEFYFYTDSCPSDTTKREITYIVN